MSTYNHEEHYEDNIDALVTTIHKMHRELVSTSETLNFREDDLVYENNDDRLIVNVVSALLRLHPDLELGNMVRAWYQNAELNALVETINSAE
jgi:hypothetical protein